MGFGEMAFCFNKNRRFTQNYNTCLYGVEQCSVFAGGAHRIVKWHLNNLTAAYFPEKKLLTVMSVE